MSVIAAMLLKTGIALLPTLQALALGRFIDEVTDSFTVGIVTAQLMESLAVFCGLLIFTYLLDSLYSLALVKLKIRVGVAYDFHLLKEHSALTVAALALLFPLRDGRLSAGTYIGIVTLITTFSKRIEWNIAYVIEDFISGRLYILDYNRFMELEKCRIEEGEDEQEKAELLALCERLGIGDLPGELQDSAYYRLLWERQVSGYEV